MSRLKTLLLAHAMIAASCGNLHQTPRRDFAQNSKGKDMGELARDKGLKEFNFHYQNGVPMFSCYVLNEKSAKKKYEKWRKQNGY